MDSDLPQIANLFLSGVRDRAQANAGGAMPRPSRTPPGGTPPAAGRSAPHGNLRVAGDEQPSSAPVNPRSSAPVGTLRKFVHVGVLVPGLAARLAGALASRSVLLEVGDSAATLSLVDPELPSDAADAEHGTAREMADALGELSSDVPTAVVSTPAPSAALLGSAQTWVVTVGDGEPEMIRAYQSLKTLANSELRELILAADGPGARPTLDRLVSVMGRFLSWQPDRTLVLSASPAHAHPVLTCADVPPCMKLAEDLGTTPLDTALDTPHDLPATALETAVREDPVPSRIPNATLGESGVPAAPAQIQPASQPTPLPATPPTAQTTFASATASAMQPPAQQSAPLQHPAPAATAMPPQAAAQIPPFVPAPVMRLTPQDDAPDEALPEIIELDGSGSDAIVDAILAGNRSLRATDIPTPTDVSCRVAVSPEGRLTLITCPAPDDLASLGTLLTWATDNLALISRATLGTTIDIALPPHLHLYTTSKTAVGLATLVASPAVKVHTYQPVRWGPRKGLLLDAA
jgi:hypothetical protein